MLLNLQITAGWEGPHALWRTGLEFKSISTNSKNVLKKEDAVQQGEVENIRYV